MSRVLPQPRKIHLCRSSSNLPHPPSLLKLFQNPHVWLSFNKMQNPLRLPEKTALERPKVGRKWNAFTILTLERASCHNGVHFLISHLVRCLCTRYLRSLLFDPPKRPFDLFARFDLMSSDYFSSLTSSLLTLSLPCLLFHLSILSEVWLLNFFRSLLYKTPRYQILYSLSCYQRTTIYGMPKYSLHILLIAYLYT